MLEYGNVRYSKCSRYFDTFLTRCCSADIRHSLRRVLKVTKKKKGSSIQAFGHYIILILELPVLVLKHRAGLNKNEQ